MVRRPGGIWPGRTGRRTGGPDAVGKISEIAGDLGSAWARPADDYCHRPPGSADRAATPSFGTASVTDSLFITDEKNQLLRHNVPNLVVFADGQQRSADFKGYFENTGAIERWGLPISEVFEEERGALTQYYQRGAVDFHKRSDLGGGWVLERRLTWDYMGGGAAGSVDMGVELNITNPNNGELTGPWGHKISNLDTQGEDDGFSRLLR